MSGQSGIHKHTHARNWKTKQQKDRKENGAEMMGATYRKTLKPVSLTGRRGDLGVVSRWRQHNWLRGYGLPGTIVSLVNCALVRLLVGVLVWSGQKELTKMHSLTIPKNATHVMVECPPNLKSDQNSASGGIHSRFEGHEWNLHKW